MLYTKSQPQSFLSSGEEVFYHIWAWQPSCSLVQNHKTKMSSQHPFDRRPYVKSGKNCARYFRQEDIQRFHDFIHIYSLRAREDYPQNFEGILSFTSLIIHCTFQPLVFNTY